METGRSHDINMAAEHHTVSERDLSQNKDLRMSSHSTKTVITVLGATFAFKTLP